MRYKIPFPKYLITDFPEIFHLIVINRDEDNPVIRQQILGHFEPGIDHVEPVCVEAPIALGIGYHTVLLFVELSAAGHVLVCGLCEVILVNEIIAGVVRRVDVYHLHFSEIGLPQEFEHLEIVSFDVEVPGAVEVHALGTAGAEGGCGRGVGVEYGVALVGPLKAVAFLVALDYFVRKFLPEQVEVDGGDDFAVFVLRLCEAVGEQSADFLYVFVYQVWGMHSEMFHMCGVI